MSKFKVGDRVRVVNPRHLSKDDLGKEFTISSDEKVWDGEQSWWGIGVNWRHKESALELAVDAPASPVRTVTRKEIVEGVYGRVKVNDTGKTGLIGLWFEGHYFKPAELRAISATALALADALDEVA